MIWPAEEKKMNMDSWARIYEKMMRLRVMTAFVWVIGTIVYTAITWYVSEKGLVLEPFLILIPSSVMIGFAVIAFGQSCPKCNEKFYGDLLRFFSTKSCRYCDYHGS